MSNKPVASLSLDLDNKWSYLKTHGDSQWESFPSYLDLVVPRFLEILSNMNLKITVFVVGQDAALEKNRESLAMISAAGHEIANHSFHHEPWLHLYTPSQLEAEFESSENAIYEATGEKTVGFRGPGFSLSNEVLKTLIRRGYQYDCSTFPTFLGPVARAYYFMRSSLSSAEKEDRKALFGKLSDGFQSNHPFVWTSENRQLLEIPVTTFPVFKIPIHMSYILYLSKFSSLLANFYFWSAIKTCRMLGVAPSILLHPLDFMGVEDDKDLSFFPAMDLPSARKIETVSRSLQTIVDNFTAVNMHEHAQLVNRDRLRQRSVATARMGAAESELAEVS